MCVCVCVCVYVCVCVCEDSELVCRHVRFSICVWCQVQSLSPPPRRTRCVYIPQHWPVRSQTSYNMPTRSKPQPSKHPCVCACVCLSLCVCVCVYTAWMLGQFTHSPAGLLGREHCAPSRHGFRHTGVVFALQAVLMPGACIWSERARARACVCVCVCTSATWVNIAWPVCGYVLQAAVLHTLTSDGHTARLPES